MTSRVAISNEALLLCGAALITSPSDTSSQAIAVNAVYNDTRDEVLRAFDWDSARRSAALGSALTDTPPMRWAYAFTLPTDPYCLIVREANNNVDFEVQGRTLLCNESSLVIRYTARIPEAQMDPTLGTAIAMRIASKVCYTLTKDKIRTRELYQAYKDVLADGGHIDSLQGTPVHPFTNTLDSVRDA